MSDMTQDETNAATESSQAVGMPEIHAHESHRKYKLIDLDNSEIEKTASELVEASKLLTNRNLWIENFKATINVVRLWCAEFKDHLCMSLVDIRSNKVLFYFVPQSDRYDLQLGSAMTALEVLLGGSAGIGYVETLQVPERSLEQFAGKRSRLVWKRSDSPAKL